MKAPTRPLLRRRPSAASERGASIVEVMVASLILSVGVIGLSTIFLASAENGAVVRGRADANDIAVSQLETIRNLPYRSIGIDPSAEGYVPRFDGRNTVTEPTANAVEPTDVVERDGVSFDVERAVTWEGDPAASGSYKVVTVTVRWSTGAGERDVVVQTGIFEAADDA